MKRKYIKLPLSSLMIRENSLFVALLYFFALSLPSSTVIMSVLICWTVLWMAVSVVMDKEYSAFYRTLVLCVLIVATALIIYGLFFSARFVQVNHSLTIAGLFFSCGSVLATGIVIICLRKRIERSQKSEEVTQRFIDAAHMLALYVVPLCNL